MQSAREEVLNRIREALKHKGEPKPTPDFATEIFNLGDVDKLQLFKDSLATKNADAFVCASEQDLLIQLQRFIAEKGYQNIFVWEEKLQEILSGSINFCATDENLHDSDVGITLVEALVARTGSMIISSAQKSGRRLNIYPPVHIGIAYRSQIVDDVADGFALMKERYGDKFPSLVSLVSGASRTADIEKTLVLGAHGPKELYIFVVND